MCGFQDVPATWNGSRTKQVSSFVEPVQRVQRFDQTPPPYQSGQNDDDTEYCIKFYYKKDSNAGLVLSLERATSPVLHQSCINLPVLTILPQPNGRDMLAGSIHEIVDEFSRMKDFDNESL